MKTTEWGQRRPKRPLLALAYFAGMALIVGWSLREGFAADGPGGAAMRRPDPAASGPPSLASPPVPEAGKARGKGTCVGCGVIEAMHRIDTPVAVMAECHAGDGMGSTGGLLNVGGAASLDSLANTVASVIADGRGRKKVAVNTRHQIIVRFRDGSRQVFDEATPRSLRVGDRILVIAGAAAPSPRLAVTGAFSNGDPWRSVRSRTDG